MFPSGSSTSNDCSEDHSIKSKLSHLFLIIMVQVRHGFEVLLMFLYLILVGLKFIQKSLF